MLSSESAPAVDKMLFLSPLSVPKQRYFSPFTEASSLTAPVAKTSAGAMENTAGAGVLVEQGDLSALGEVSALDHGNAIRCDISPDRGEML